MRGTWTGSGTFKTSGGPDLFGLVLVAVVVGAAVAVAVAVADFVAAYIWWIVGIAAVAGIGVVYFAVVYRRKLDAQAARLEATREVRHARIRAAEAAERKAQVTQGTQPQAIEHHYHGPSIHIHGGGHDEAASLIRKALSAQPGYVITSKEE